MARGHKILAVLVLIQSGAAQALTQAEKDEMLEVHNKYRCLHGLGQTSLVWDEGLAADGQAWADQLAASGQFYHNSAELQSKGQGENLAMRWGSSTPYAALPAASAWYNEIQYTSPYGAPASSDCSKSCREGVENEMLGHYTQMLWVDTTMLGCGRAQGVYQSKPSFVWACRYKVAGNVYQYSTGLFAEGKVLAPTVAPSAALSTCGVPLTVAWLHDGWNADGETTNSSTTEEASTSTAEETASTTMSTTTEEVMATTAAATSGEATTVAATTTEEVMTTTAAATSAEATTTTPPTTTEQATTTQAATTVTTTTRAAEVTSTTTPPAEAFEGQGQLLETIIALRRCHGATEDLAWDAKLAILAKAYLEQPASGASQGRYRFRYHGSRTMGDVPYFARTPNLRDAVLDMYDMALYAPGLSSTLRSIIYGTMVWKNSGSIGCARVDNVIMCVSDLMGKWGAWGTQVMSRPPMNFDRCVERRAGARDMMSLEVLGGRVDDPNYTLPEGEIQIEGNGDVEDGSLDLDAEGSLSSDAAWRASPTAAAKAAGLLLAALAAASL
mmetsp:Transcript_92871/g.267167  ORF Transcript_92871/g.267167 Transcript_92871/m.267167 type:complete len:557 (-) Transcript_92871:98-1768(-)